MKNENDVLNDSTQRLRMEDARATLRRCGYSLKKVDGEFIARPYNAVNDNCTIYADDLASAVSSAMMDTKVYCWQCGNRLTHSGLDGHNFYCGACEISVPLEDATVRTCPDGMRVADLKQALENYPDDMRVRIITPVGSHDILKSKQGMYTFDLVTPEN